MKLTPETLNPQFLKRTAKYNFSLLDIEALSNLGGRKEDWIPQAFLTTPFSKGDFCSNLLDKDSLASYSWYSTHSSMVTDELEVNFDNDYVYQYKGYTYPDYRGQRLHAIGKAKALVEFSNMGYKGLFSIVESNNFASIKSNKRQGYKDFAKFYVFKVTGKYFIFSKGEFKKYSFEIKPIK